jgi:hypothetical protein
VIQSHDLRAAAAAAGTDPPETTVPGNQPLPLLNTTTTSPDQRPPYPPLGRAITDVQLLFGFDNKLYGVRYEAFGDGGSFVPLELPGPDRPGGSCLDDRTDWKPAPPELLLFLNVRGVVTTLASGEQRQYVVRLPPETPVIAAFSRCSDTCSAPVVWNGALVFNPCPDTGGAGPTTTTTAPTTTTSTTLLPGARQLFGG